MHPFPTLAVCSLARTVIPGLVLAGALMCIPDASAQLTLGSVSTLAGSPEVSGNTDGTGATALFSYPEDIVVDASGIVYVADAQNYRIRRITPAGAVTTLAGGVYGATDATGAAARFSAPFGIAIDGAGTLYVSDTYNATIRRVTPAGVVTTIAGLAGVNGSNDGPAPLARFELPQGLAVDALGNVFVADTANHTIRRISVAGTVSTFAGTAGAEGYVNATGAAARFAFPQDVALDASGTLYVSDGENNAVRMVTPAGVVTTLAQSDTLDRPEGLAVGADGTVWVVSRSNHAVFAITPAGAITRAAGVAGLAGAVNGAALYARFNGPAGLAIDVNGTLFVADALNHTIRRVAPSASADDIAITQHPQPATAVVGAAATFSVAATHGLPVPLGFRWQRRAAGSLVWSDLANSGPYSGVTDPMLTITGATLAMSGDSFRCIVSNSITPDVTSMPASFTVIAGIEIVGQPTDVTTQSPVYASFAVTGTGPLPLSYQWQVSTDGVQWSNVVDGGAYAGATLEVLDIEPTDPSMNGLRFRVIVSDGTSPSVTSATAMLIVSEGYVFRTLAGNPGQIGSVDGTGTGALFNRPRGIVRGTDGNFYVTELNGGTIRRVTPAGAVTILAGGGPFGLPGDGTGRAAYFRLPWGIATDAAGNLYVADSGNATIRKITPEGVVTTLAGSAGQTGSADGTGSAARFGQPQDIALDAAGALYVTDVSNHTIRRVTPDGVVTTFAGAVNTPGTADGPLATARFNRPSDLAFDSSGALFVVDSGNNTIRKITAAGVVSTFAGTAGQYGSVDGAGAAARFRGLGGITISADDTIFIPDTADQTLCRITPDGNVTRIGGVSGFPGLQDGPGIQAWFNAPWEIALDAAGHLYLTDGNNQVIRTTTVEPPPGAPVITTQPQDATTPSGGNATFTVVATSTAPFPFTYRWQIQAVGSTGWTDAVDSGALAGATTDTLSVTGATLAMSGFRFRCIVSNTVAPAAISAPGGLTVTAGAATISLTGLATTYSGTAQTPTATTLPAGLAVSLTYNGAATAPSNAGSYAVLATISEAGYAGSASGTFVIAPAPLIARADDQTKGLGFENPPLTISYTGFVNGETAAVLDAPPTASTSALTASPQGTYPITLTGGSDTNYSFTLQNGTLTIGPDPGIIILAQPQDTTVLPGDVAVFSIGAGGNQPLAYAWEISSDGGATWTAIANDADSSGSTTATLTIANTVTAWTGRQVRVVLSDGVHPTIVSGVASLKVFNVITLAGARLESGSADGPGFEARFTGVNGPVVDSAGNLFVSDAGNNGTIRRISLDGMVSTYVGVAGDRTVVDGPAAVARFENPGQLAIDPSGTLFVAEGVTVRKITPDRVVSTLAGSRHQVGSADGQGAAARFSSIWGLAIDRAGNLYVADFANHTIRKITPGGLVSTLAGAAGEAGYRDGPGALARFNLPNAIAVDDAGNVFVSDQQNVCIRKITPDGVVTTFAGRGGGMVNGTADGKPGQLRGPHALAVDRAGQVYVADGAFSSEFALRRISPSGVMSTISRTPPGYEDGPMAEARFSGFADLAVDSAGRLYVTDGAYLVRKVGFDRMAASFTLHPNDAYVLDGSDVVFTAEATGSPPPTYQWQRSTDSGASWHDVQDDVTSRGARSFELTVRSVSLATHGDQYRLRADQELAPSTFSDVAVLSVNEGYAFTTLSGNPVQRGASDGPRPFARFFSPEDVALDAAGNLYVADTGNDSLRRITAEGAVSTLLGGTYSPLAGPAGVAVDPAGTVYVANTLKNRIDTRTASGGFDWLAGFSSSSASGTADGPGAAARFFWPHRVARDAAGYLYVADTRNHTIRRISPAGMVTTVAGLGGEAGRTDGAAESARFNLPEGIAVASSGEIYVADTGNHTIRRIAADGTVSTVAGLAATAGDTDGPSTNARFRLPAGVAVDSAGVVFVADTGNSVIRRITPDGHVSTLAGVASQIGATDGSGVAARFSAPHGIAVDGEGQIYVADTANSRICVGVYDPRSPVVTVAPQNLTVARGLDAVFTVAASGRPRPFQFQWQRSSDGGVNWTDIADDSTYAGAQTARLTIDGASVALDGMRYRVAVGNGVGAEVLSSSATLTVEPLSLATIAGGSFASTTGGATPMARRGLAADAVGSGAWGLHVSPGGDATFIAHLPARRSAIALTFAMMPEGSFSAQGIESVTAGQVAGSFTLSGQIAGGVVSGSIPEFGLSFSAAVSSPSGVTQEVAGLYRADLLNGMTGRLHLIVGGDGLAVIVGLTSTWVGGGLGTADAAGALSIALDDALLSGGLDPSSPRLNLAITPTGVPRVLEFAGLETLVTPVKRLANISTRGFAGTGGQVMIAGFIVTGAETKQILLRAVGPGLAAYLPPGEQTDVLADPQLDLFRSIDGVSTLVAHNNDWQAPSNDLPSLAAATATVGAFALPADSRDAVLLTTLEPGVYTAIASGVGGLTGVTLVEAYEISAATDTAPRLINISTRGQVSTGNAVMIAGFVVAGNTPKQVLIRGVGPGLAPFLAPADQALVLADPRIELFDARGAPITANDDWGTGDKTQINAAFSATGAFALPTDSKDSVLLVHLAPGRYTVHVSGVGGSTGVALAEIYELP